jgi:hypothetical protein
MEEKFDTFRANIPDQAIEVSDKSNEFQCMDLAYLWTFVLGFPKGTIQHQFAYQVFTNASDLTRKYFEIIANSATAVPQKGDVVVFSDKKLDGSPFNAAGHIAIATGVGDTRTFESLDQNWGDKKVKVVSHNYDNPVVLGWLRPKLTTADIISDLKTKLDFKGFETPLEKYDILEFQALQAKLLAKDTRISQLEALPTSPVFTKPIAKLHFDLANEFEKAATA